MPRAVRPAAHGSCQRRRRCQGGTTRAPRFLPAQIAQEISTASSEDSRIRVCSTDPDGWLSSKTGTSTDLELDGEFPTPSRTCGGTESPRPLVLSRHTSRTSRSQTTSLNRHHTRGSSFWTQMRVSLSEADPGPWNDIRRYAETFLVR